jgi:hypothetical protein
MMLITLKLENNTIKIIDGNMFPSEGRCLEQYDLPSTRFFTERLCQELIHHWFTEKSKGKISEISSTGGDRMSFFIFRVDYI